ncbi:hypothetical protein K505DRAFT_323542 [Melanomma pulvis-pyrius CBS 109.77]|uniref:Uncharacterized protein n=1 Tax=Melanomma pulvis-pyrius CBS 109.77 TaxID=1314802 RepID=A0A6A6XIY7_9PLEO|nr:hypothetical protein K505DRAFT_323542 [Melanomma pulvis-pyrius CBS 109.77]
MPSHPQKEAPHTSIASPQKPTIVVDDSTRLDSTRLAHHESPPSNSSTACYIPSDLESQTYQAKPPLPPAQPKPKPKQTQPPFQSPRHTGERS